MSKENSGKHIAMDDELAANLEKEFNRIANEGVVGDPNGKLAYGYLRVSTRGQAEEGASGLPRQLEHIAEKAAQEGLAIPWEMVYCDDHTGFTFEDRPGLNALLEEAGTKPRAHDLVIEYPDRMSRDHTWRYGYIREQFQKCDVEYHYWQGYRSEIERTVMGTMSEMGMRKELERMHFGMLKKARSGRVTAKKPAYGYKFVDSGGRDRTDPDSKWRKDKHYAIVEEEAEVVRLVYERLAYEGGTLIGIANYLNDRGVSPPGRSTHWQQSWLSKMVKSPLYKGEFVAHRWYYTKVWSERSRRMVLSTVERPKQEWIVVPVPAMVSSETWKLAQEALRRNQSKSTRNTRYSFLLVNLLTCAECDFSFSAKTRVRHNKGREYISLYYLCGGRKHQMEAIRESVGCTQSQISARKLDPVVWGVIMDFFTSPEMLTLAVDQYYAGAGMDRIQSQIDFIDQQIAEREQEDDRLYKAYLKGAFDEQEFADRRHVITTALDALEQEREALSDQIVTKEELGMRKQAVEDVMERMRAQFLALDVPFELKRQIVRMLIESIDLNVNEGWFKLNGILKGTFSIENGQFVSTPADQRAWPPRGCRARRR